MSELNSFPQMEKFIYELFEEQAEIYPDRTAIVFNGQAITFGELNNRSNQLGKYIRGKKIMPNEIIAVVMDRSIEMVISLIAIIKSGAAYLPIDPKFPKERVEFILDNSKSRLVICQKKYSSALEAGLLLNIDEFDFTDQRWPNLSSINQPSDLMYVIYTSGSTGSPKGVMIEHRSITNRILWAQKQYPMSHDDVFLFKTPYTFDVSLPEIFWAGLAAATICILPSGEEANPKLIAELIAAHKITRIHFVPSMLNAFLDYITAFDSADVKSLRQVYASGESLPLSSVSRFNEFLFQKYGTRLINLYGPTEAAVDVSFFECSPLNSNTVPIGKPIDNIRLYVFDRFKQLQPPGIQGELYISGVGVARGYLNNEVLTREYFQKDPFFPNQMMYRTGDFARLNNDGNIEFLGRVDNQIKIDGYRIELGEIEETMRQHETVKDCVIVLKLINNQKKLAAYFTATDTVSTFQLKKFLSAKLPVYYVPAFLIHILELPLTSSGKVNRRYLESLPIEMSTPDTFLAPKTDLQNKVASIWKAILVTDKVGTSDNFFSLGGSSILAIKVITAIKSELGIEITLNDLISKDLERICDKCEHLIPSV